MIRPKHVDTDKPEGYIKRKLRRWLRVWVKRETRAIVASEKGGAA